MGYPFHEKSSGRAQFRLVKAATLKVQRKEMLNEKEIAQDQRVEAR
jgi:hypothetical protein